ncbi:putative flippase GtrA [Neobacillus niacini]|uniref:hypothetical protein n=1 Tax=Neobacillus niacini TaxID=86668 RepID=UPI002860CA2B|nr:hypothetical protein [Neobacillus niacini]MDR7077420.1 putative flippase GtrA [Neobacillus niacini]
MDERSQKFIAKGMAITLGLVYLYLIVSCIWKYTSTKDITNSTMEIILIVMIPVSIGWFARKDESLLIPKMVTGEHIPTGSDHQSKNRRKRYYFWDSLGLAIVFLILNIIGTLFIEKDWQHLLLFPQWSGKMNILVTLSMEFIISIIVFYTISYIWDEWNVKRYNRKLDELENYDE